MLQQRFLHRVCAWIGFTALMLTMLSIVTNVLWVPIGNNHTVLLRSGGLLLAQMDYEISPTSPKNQVFFDIPNDGYPKILRMTPGYIAGKATVIYSSESYWYGAGIGLAHYQFEYKINGWKGTTTVGVFPIWILSFLLIVPTIRSIKERQKKGRQARNECPSCGYDLRASPKSCPECGAPKDASQPPHALR